MQVGLWNVTHDCGLSVIQLKFEDDRVVDLSVAALPGPSRTRSAIRVFQFSHRTEDGEKRHPRGSSWFERGSHL